MAGDRLNIDKSNEKGIIKRLVRTGEDALENPDIFNKGRIWYPSVNEAMSQADLGSDISMGQRAGIISALSPAMDFSANNIHALDEIQALMDSDQAALRGAVRRHAATRDDRGQLVRRPAEISQEMAKVMPKTGGTMDQFIVEAMDIYQGGDYHDVFSPTSFKRRAFAQNNEDPGWHIYGHQGPMNITSDYHHADLLANTLRGGKVDRGLDAIGRYRDHGMVTIAAHNLLSRRHPREWADMTPSDTQAVLWEQVKHLESRFGTMQQSVPRTGLPIYMGSTGNGRVNPDLYPR